MKGLPEHLLKILVEEAQLSIFGAGSVLIRDNDAADIVYMLVMGQVEIKQQLTEDVDVIFALVQSGATFGVPALLEGQLSSYTAVCQEPCEVITISGQRLRELFETNHELAYYMFIGAANQYKNNMHRRAQMVMKVVDQNPELKETLDIEIETMSI